MTEIPKIDVKIKQPHFAAVVLEQLLKFPMRYAISDGAGKTEVDLCITDQTDVFLESYDAEDSRNILFIGTSGDVLALPPEIWEKYGITLPCKVGAIMKKIDHYLFAMGAERDLDVTMGQMRLQSQSKQLSNIAHGQKMPLTDRETEILTYLYQQDGKIVSRDTLLRQIWQFHPDVSTHTLETHIYRLRQKFQKLGLDDHLYLSSEDGGYALNILND